MKREAKALLEEGSVNLTPLIDCVFQLLIFFMVSTVFLHTRGLDVDLPGKAEATEEQKRKDINIIIDAEGKIEVNGRRVSMGDLGPRIIEAMEETKNENVIIEADRETLHNTVVEVVDISREVGIKGIAFASVEQEGG